MITGYPEMEMFHYSFLGEDKNAVSDFFRKH